MARIKIRIWGNLLDLNEIAGGLLEDPNVVSISKPYPNRPPSKEYRMYIEYDY